MEKHQPPKEPTPKQKHPLKDFSKYSTVSFKMIAIVVAGVYGGVKLDAYLELETPIFTLLFSLLSVALAMYVVIRDVSK